MTRGRRVYFVCGHISKFIGTGHPDFITKKHPDFGKKQNPDLRWYITDTIRHTLNHHNGFKVPARLIDQIFVGNFGGELFANQGHLGAAVADADPALLYKPSMRIEAGGLAFATAVKAIKGGDDINLVIGAEVQSTVAPRTAADYLARAADYARQRSLDDFVFPAIFANRMKHYLAAHKHVTMDDMSYISWKAMQNATRNPKAHMHHAKTSLEELQKAPTFLTNPDLKPWMRLSDCSQLSDGAAGLIVASSEGLHALGLRGNETVEILACEHACGNLYEDSDPLVMNTTKAAADRAYTVANRRPSDMEVIELHDAFTITEALMLEALGFAKKGEGALLAKNGVTAHDGRIPCNPGGGLIGNGHATGATGIQQIIEVAKQMYGITPGYQLDKRIGHGIVANMAGDDKTAVVTILRHGDLASLESKQDL